jgi:UDP-N-acetylmuramate--L-alanine ligase/UDP-N-acetylenolpyruvoylglucosamine reductase
MKSAEFDLNYWVHALARGGAGPSTVHLVGAGGCGMSALGHLLLDLNCQISGSDLSSGAATRQLADRGAHIHVGHKAEHVHQSTPQVVVYSAAVKADNPELAEARKIGLPVVRRATLLAALLREQRGICVAGMHGKSTTSALLAYALEQLGADPSYAIGASVPQLSRSARWRNPTPTATTANDRPPPLFVVEADESDGTLRQFAPLHALVLNVDEEHLDHFADLQAICAEFAGFIAQTRDLLVYSADDPHLPGLCVHHPRAVSFGFSPSAVYRIETVAPAEPGGPMRFLLNHDGRAVGPFEVQLLGPHNISNAAAAAALLMEIGYDPCAVARALKDFRGALRRQELLFRDDRWQVYDDYGHHPVEIEATLKALRSCRPRRLLVAFQPHRYSRTQQLLSRFATCFKEADRLWLTDVYAASETPLPGVDGRCLANAVRNTGQVVDYCPDQAQLPQAIRSALQPGDLVLFQGAGDITAAAHAFAEALRGVTPGSTADAADILRQRLSRHAVVRSEEPLARRTTFRVGGRADLYVEPASEDDLQRLLEFCVQARLTWRVLGRGSNLLVRDGGIRGVVVNLSQPAFSQILPEGPRLRCGAGARLKTVAREARRHTIGGLEFLEGIPGTVGGALRMNAGAMGSWIFDVIESLCIMDPEGRVQEIPAAAAAAAYRNCPLLQDRIALSTVIHGYPSNSEAIEARRQAFSKKRWTSQPSAPSAGCIFKNPGSASAGRLIDELGLKGARVGGAVVSGVHANFIVNDGTATARDVLALIDLVRERVNRAHGIHLETEVEIVGEG